MVHRSSGDLRDPGVTANCDLVVVGAGAAGMATAMAAASAGAAVVVIDAAAQVGGALHLATGQLSAAGTRLQRDQQIVDSAQSHYDDIMRISRGTANRDLVRLAVERAAETLDWLVDELEMPVMPGHPVTGDTHEHYSAARYVWGPNRGRSILTALLKPWTEALASRTVIVRSQTKVTGLLWKDSVVAGVTTDRGSDVRAPRVVLATGGYNANPEFFERVTGERQYADASYPFARGEGHVIGLQAGGFLRGRENYLCSFGSVLDHHDYPAPVLCRPVHWPEQRQPWEIYVNAAGQRFVAEDEPSVDAREHALREQPGMRRFIIFDEKILRRSPPLIPGWDSDDIREHAGSHPMFHVGSTWSELAERSGVDSEGLTETVMAYNDALDGADPLGRLHRPAPVSQPPFYSIEVQGMSITSSVGLAVDQQLRVIRPQLDAIEGLYAVGEILGSSQFMGNSFCGGMLATPALSLGRDLGRRVVAA